MKFLSKGCDLMVLWESGVGGGLQVGFYFEVESVFEGFSNSSIVDRAVNNRGEVGELESDDCVGMIKLVELFSNMFLDGVYGLIGAVDWREIMHGAGVCRFKGGGDVFVEGDFKKTFLVSGFAEGESFG